MYIACPFVYNKGQNLCIKMSKFIIFYSPNQSLVFIKSYLYSSFHIQRGNGGGEIPENVNIYKFLKEVEPLSGSL